jgi:crotonobetainyl-CoA hydratase
MKDAMWLALTGKRMSAEHARRARLINDIVPRGTAFVAAQVLAREMLECAPLALEASKQVLLQSADEPGLETAILREYSAARAMLQSDDAREGPRAFAEKRKPQWRGR